MSLSHNTDRTFRIYYNMRTRCLNQNYRYYSRYGGRGITICERWLSSFDNFLEDMGECPSNKHTLDRSNNDGNYEPSNCRWATWSEQANNKSSNRVIIYRGEQRHPVELARDVGIPRTTINSWLNIYQMSDAQLEDAIDKRLNTL